MNLDGLKPFARKKNFDNGFYSKRLGGYTSREEVRMADQFDAEMADENDFEASLPQEYWDLMDAGKIKEAYKIREIAWEKWENA